MKKLLFIVCLLLTLISSNCQAAYQNEPDHFRNFIWGESVESVRSKYPNNMQLNQIIDDRRATYTVYTSELELGHLEIKPDINIVFIENKLASVCVEINTNGLQDSVDKYKTLTADLVSMYGQATYSNNSGDPNLPGGKINYLIWLGEKTNIGAVFNRANLNGSLISKTLLTLMSTKIMNEDFEYNKKSAARGW